MSEPIFTTEQSLALCERHIRRVKELRHNQRDTLAMQRIAHTDRMRKIAVTVRMHLRAAGIETDPWKM